MVWRRRLPAAQHSSQVLMFEGKNCSHFRAFTTSAAASPYAQQEEQSLCRRLLGLTAGRKRLGDSTLGEAGQGDGHHGAKTTMPTGGHHAHMWAPPETRRRGRG